MMSLGCFQPRQMSSLNQLLLTQIDNLKQHCWLANLENFYPYERTLTQFLSPEEKRKSNAIKMKKSRLRYCLRKGITRLLLGSLMERDPREVNYFYNSYGKPYLNQGEGLSFNVSHSKNYLLVGIIRDSHIGVDIEKINRNLNHPLLAPEVLSPQEMDYYRAYGEEKQCLSFYRAWVQKEAISKALGLGISIGFNRLTVRIDPTLGEEEYVIALAQMKYPIRIRVKLKDDYIMATAIPIDYLWST